MTTPTNPAPESAGPCGHHYSWGQRCQQPPDAEVHKWGLAQYGHSTPDGMPRHPWTPLYADTPLSTPAAPQPETETEGMTFDEVPDLVPRLLARIAADASTIATLRKALEDVRVIASNNRDAEGFLDWINDIVSAALDEGAK